MAKCKQLTFLPFKGLSVQNCTVLSKNKATNKSSSSSSSTSVIFVNKNENGEKRENNKFVNEN